MNRLLTLTLVVAFIATSLAASFKEREVDCEKRDLKCLKRRELGAIYDEVKRACINYVGYWCEDKKQEIEDLDRKLLELPNEMPPEEAAEEPEEEEEEEQIETKREEGGCASRHLGFWCKKKRDLIQDKINEIKSSVENYAESKREGPAPAKPGCQSKYLGFWC